MATAGAMKVIDWNRTSVRPIAFRSSPAGSCWAIGTSLSTRDGRGHPGGTRVACILGSRSEPGKRKTAVCEHFVARAAEPFRLDELWSFAERLERFGLAGYGWGAAWVGADGRLASYRDVRAFRDDPGRDAVGAHETTSLLVHLRRPSRFSTLTIADT